MTKLLRLALLLAALLCSLGLSSSVFVSAAATTTNRQNPEAAKEGGDGAASVDKHEADDKNGGDIHLPVVVLTADNFWSSIGDGNRWLIEFYAPWCGHCQTFSSTYDDIAATFHSNPEDGIRVGKVDCDAEQAICARFSISSFPCFYLIDGWSVYEFTEARSQVNLINFCRGGYQKQEPMPMWTSPMGPMGLLKGALLAIGSKLMSIASWLFEYSPIWAGMVICFLGTVGGIISIVLFTILTTPKEKVS